MARTRHLQRQRFNPVTPRGYAGAVEATDGACDGILGITEAGDRGRGARRLADRTGSADGRWKDFDVYAAGILHAGRDDNCGNAVWR